MPGQHRKSGGARDVERKHAQRTAERPDGYNDRAIAAFKRIRVRDKSAAGALDEAFAFLRQALREAATDPGLPPEQRREQTGRLAASLTKAADPKKQLDDMGAELRHAHAELTALREEHAAQEPPGDPGGPAADTPH